MIIAIDGPAGSGKSSVAKKLSLKLGIPYIDTGAMYRALTLACLKENINFHNPEEILSLARRIKIDLKFKGLKSEVYLEEVNVSNEIRKPIIDALISNVARIPEVREEMVKKQRQIGLKNGGVMEGRDIGTVVFPDADFKFYLDAQFDIRVERRYQELLQRGEKISREKVSQDLKLRDESDFKREVGPLKRAKDAIYVDTSQLSIEEVVDKLLGYINSKK